MDKKASNKTETKKADKAKVVTSDKIKSNVKRDVSSDALEEVTLLKDHGNDKKGDKLMRHPNTADMLRLHKIAK